MRSPAVLSLLLLAACGQPGPSPQLVDASADVAATDVAATDVAATDVASDVAAPPPPDAPGDVAVADAPSDAPHDVALADAPSDAPRDVAVADAVAPVDAPSDAPRDVAVADSPVTPADAGGDALADSSVDAPLVPDGAEVPDFSLPDLNPASRTHRMQVSPRGLRGRVTAWYFASAT